MLDLVFYTSKLVQLNSISWLQIEIDFKTLRPDVNSLALFSEWASLSSFVQQQVQKKDAEFLDDPTLTTGKFLTRYICQCKGRNVVRIGLQFL